MECNIGNPPVIACLSSSSRHSARSLVTAELGICYCYCVKCKVWLCNCHSQNRRGGHCPVCGLHPVLNASASVSIMHCFRAAIPFLRRGGWCQTEVHLHTVEQLSGPLHLGSTTWRSARLGNAKKTWVNVIYKTSYLKVRHMWLGLLPLKKGQLLECSVECGRSASVKSDILVSLNFLCC